MFFYHILHKFNCIQVFPSMFLKEAFKVCHELFSAPCKNLDRSKSCTLNLQMPLFFNVLFSLFSSVQLEKATMIRSTRKCQPFSKPVIFVPSILVIPTLN